MFAGFTFFVCRRGGVLDNLQTILVGKVLRHHTLGNLEVVGAVGDIGAITAVHHLHILIFGEGAKHILVLRILQQVDGLRLGEGGHIGALGEGDILAVVFEVGTVTAHGGVDFLAVELAHQARGAVGILLLLLLQQLHTTLQRDFYGILILRDGDKLVSISDDESTIYTITYDDKGRIATINASGEEMIYTYTYDGSVKFFRAYLKIGTTYYYGVFSFVPTISKISTNNPPK